MQVNYKYIYAILKQNNEVVDWAFLNTINGRLSCFEL